MQGNSFLKLNETAPENSYCINHNLHCTYSLSFSWRAQQKMLFSRRNVVFSSSFLGRFLSTRPFKPVQSSSNSTEFEADFTPHCDDRHLAPRVACTAGKEARKAWIETLKSRDTNIPVGMTDLHPDVFAVFPRMDLVYKNLYWQAHYRLVVSFNISH